MKFIIVDNHSGKNRSFSANGLALGFIITGLMGIPLFIGIASYFYGLGEAGLNDQLVGKWREVLYAQQNEVAEAKAETVGISSELHSMAHRESLVKIMNVDF